MHFTQNCCVFHSIHYSIHPISDFFFFNISVFHKIRNRHQLCDWIWINPFSGFLSGMYGISLLSAPFLHLLPFSPNLVRLLWKKKQQKTIGRWEKWLPANQDLALFVHFPETALKTVSFANNPSLPQSLCLSFYCVFALPAKIQFCSHLGSSWNIKLK